jgi:peptidyl-tRNA hydrolase
MNESGPPGRAAGEVLLGAAADVVVIHDELDIEFGRSG